MRCLQDSGTIQSKTLKSHKFYLEEPSQAWGMEWGGLLWMLSSLLVLIKKNLETPNCLVLHNDRELEMLLLFFSPVVGTEPRISHTTLGKHSSPELPRAFHFYFGAVSLRFPG